MKDKEILNGFAKWLRPLIGNSRKADVSVGNEYDHALAKRHTHVCDKGARRNAPGDFDFHCYEISHSASWSVWKDKAPDAYKKRIWFCESILDAERKYSWMQAKKSFCSLAEDLQTAMAKGCHQGTRIACEAVLKWGGTPYSQRMSNWMESQVNRQTLIQSLRDATDLLRGGATGSLARFGKHGDLLMNSGMSKIYVAVALNSSTGTTDVLLYDGRVGAALGLLARRYCVEKGWNSVPPALTFRWSKGRDSSSSSATGTAAKPRQNRRDPSQAPYKFGSLGADSQRHAELARRGATLIQKAIAQSGQSTVFSRVERGLFMIGYDVRYRCCKCERTS